MATDTVAVEEGGGVEALGACTSVDRPARAFAAAATTSAGPPAAEGSPPGVGVRTAATLAERTEAVASPPSAAAASVASAAAASACSCQPRQRLFATHKP